MVKLLWLQSAKDDLKDIFDFIAADSNKYARHQIKQIRERASGLESNPYLGKVVPEYDLNSIREISISHYRIIYRIKHDDLIHIILVHHGARRFPRLEDSK